MKSTLRLSALALSVLIVGVIMLTAGAIAYLITLSLFPFCYVRNTASLYLALLLCELDEAFARETVRKSEEI